MHKGEADVKEKKEIYSMPDMEILYLTDEDIVTESGPENTDDEGNWTPSL